MQTGPNDRPVRKARPPKVKPRVVKAPAGDIASSGGDYGMKQAKRAEKAPAVKRAQQAVYSAQPVVRRKQILANATGSVAANVKPVHVRAIKRNRQLAHDQAQHDVSTDQDRARAADYLLAHPEIMHPEHPHHGGVLGTITGAATTGLKIAAAVNPATALAGGVNLLSKGGVEKAAKNAPLDAAELAVTTPSSVAKLASTAVHHPEQVPGMLAQPYIDFAKDPGKALTERPVSTALMLAPTVRMPGRVVGKVARVAGKQTLERPAATLPGTALKDARTGSRDVVVRAVQKRVDRKNPAPSMTDADVQRRVDEFYDVGQQHKRRAVASATKEAKRRGLTGEARAEHISGARGGAGNTIDERFAREFGSTYQRTPQGAIVRPKNATEGHLHTSRADADAVAKRVPFDANVMQVGDKYAVVPRVAAERFARHGTVGTSPAIGAKVFRVTGKSFRTAVLPTSSKWLTGQVTEAAQRAAVAGAGPTSFLRARKVIRKLEAEQPGKGVELAQRATSGGQFSPTSTARDFADGTRTLADEFEGSALGKPAKALTAGAAMPGIKHVRQGWHHYTNAVFDVVNGSIERTAQTAMLGKAIKDSPLMERSIIGLSDKAIADAAKGLHATENQVALARQVRRMYGQYTAFGPDKRETLLHTTPFYPWYRNVVTFLLKVLPVDHPMTAALLADIDKATEEWRKANKLSLHAPHVPLYMLGSYPDGHGGYKRFGRYTPFAPADIAGAVGDLVFPQGAAAIANLSLGVDWKGDKLTHGKHGPDYTQPERFLEAAKTTALAHVPGAAPVTRVVTRVKQGKTVGQALNKEYNPIAPTSPPKAKTTRRRVIRKQDILKLGVSQRELDILANDQGKLPLP